MPFFCCPDTARYKCPSGRYLTFSISKLPKIEPPLPMAPEPPHPQDEVQAHSIQDPESFWTHQAEQLHWHKKPSRALAQPRKSLSNGISHPSFTWFPDGEISTSYNCIDRHVKNGNGDSTAIIWDSPVTGSKEKYTYSQLLQEVGSLAGALREEGVRKGDVVLVYSMNSRHLWVCIRADTSQCL